MVPVAHNLTAQRFAGKPLRQPNYSMRDVPYCHKDLSHSKIYEVTNRDHFNDAMAEMVLLCNEVIRRKSNNHKRGNSSNSNGNGGDDAMKKTASKPLSLEYIADRCDVDDPIWGFIVRTNTQSQSLSQNNIANPNKFQPGMMQGFITVTTFTNWQKSFRWDSMHDSAFAYDDDNLAKLMADRTRKFDFDGSLAAEMQNTVRCGDPWNEGIVWPRVAEISLFGGLGCGKALLSLVLERLECMQANSEQNYDYVVLQATTNSISFYESMGFIRIGAVTENKQQKDDDDKEQEANQSFKTDIVTGPIKKVKSDNSKESLRKFCSRLSVDVWDVIFLNKHMFPGISIKSVIQPETELYVPDLSKLDGGSNAETLNKNGDGAVTQWYDAKDNETPREISKKFDICLKELLAANKGRIQGLQAHSKLVEGTRLQVSNLHVHHDEHVPYCHWTFPDDKFENNEPSYMMAKKLNRCSRKEAKVKPVENSLAIEVTKYEPPPSSLYKPKTLGKNSNIDRSPLETPNKVSKKRKIHPDQPMPPKRPKTGFFFFLDSERQRMKDSDSMLPTAEFMKVSAVKWNELSSKEKSFFEIQREEAIMEYEKEMKKYKLKMEEFKAEHPEWEQQVIQSAPQKIKKAKDFFNKVVRLNKDGRKEAGTEFEYYYVLTYIPDLFWCHLAPLRRKGVFGSKSPKKGRTRWVLVGEDEGKELDISAAVCEVVKSRCMKRCIDADKEEWDIIDPFERSLSTPSITSTTFSAAKVTSSDDSDVESECVQKQMVENDTLYSRLLKKRKTK